jgi:hypothetical protein
MTVAALIDSIDDRASHKALRTLNRVSGYEEVTRGCERQPLADCCRRRLIVPSVGHRNRIQLDQPAGTAWTPRRPPSATCAQMRVLPQYVAAQFMFSSFSEGWHLAALRRPRQHINA